MGLTSLAELLFLIRSLHREKGCTLAVLHIQIFHLVDNLKSVQIRHVEIEDHEGERSIIFLFVVLEVRSDSVHCLLSVSHIGHIACFDAETLLNQRLHGDDHELHVVSHEDFLLEVFDWKEVLLLLLWLVDGILLRSELSHDFFDVLWQPPHSVFFEACLLDFFTARHRTLHRKSKGAA